MPFGYSELRTLLGELEGCFGTELLYVAHTWNGGAGSMGGLFEAS